MKRTQYTVIVVPWMRQIGHRLVLPNWLAITIGRWIFTWRPLSIHELAHELAHVRQWQRYGVTFIPRYVRASERAARAGKDRYADNYFEAMARDAAVIVAARYAGRR